MFKVEDGTGQDDANSYGGVAEFIAYWATRGTDLSDTEGELIQAALVKATDYIELRFASKFKGRRVTVEQALSWPRKRVYTREGVELSSASVPISIKKATFEYAKRALTAELLPDPTVNPNVASTTETIGPISTTVTYKGSAVASVIQPYPSADKLLNDFITYSGGTFR